MHFWKELGSDAVGERGICIAEVVLKVINGHDVSLLELAVVLELGLDRIVGQVHFGLANRSGVQRVLRRSCPNVALFEHISRLVSHKDPNPDVKLASCNQQRLLHVLLYDKGGRL